MPLWNALPVLLTSALLAGCGRLDQLLYEPLTTPQQWCERRPCVLVAGVVFNEPLGSFLVFLLAFLWIAAGVFFLRSHPGQRSRRWLGVALVLGGIGAVQAGVSYQAFSYLLKCAGREYCVLTNGWEVGYSVTQAMSVSAMLISIAYACTRGRCRRGIMVYAWGNALLYVLMALAGSFLPSRVLLSFEVLMLFALPGILLVMAIAARSWLATRHAGDASLWIASILLLAVQVAYFSYAAAGITAQLWRDGNGFYFSENDVLHVGMILWLAYLVVFVGRDLADIDSGEVRPLGGGTTD